MGGHINNYLLEKSRVIHQQAGDNNFHSFYQLLKGGPDNLLKSLKLNRDSSQYRYLSSNNNKVTLPPKVSFCFEYTEHTEQFQGLRSMKMSREMLQNLPYFWNEKTQFFLTTLDLL